MTLRLYDTTLRDGTQREGLSLSVEDKVKIARALDRLGVSYIEGGWPGSNPKDAEFFRRIRAVPLVHARVAAFGSTRRAGVRCEEDASLRALVDAETPVVTLVGKSSTLHVERILETTRAENLRMIGESVAFFKRLGREVIYDAEHFFDGYRLDPAYALETLAAAADGRRRLPRAVRHQRRRAARRRRRARARGPRRASRRPSASTRTTTRGSRVANGLAAVRAGLRAGAGHDQRLRRALRQPRSRAAGRDAPAQARLRGAAGRRRSAGSPRCRSSSPRSPTSIPIRTRRTSAGARSPTRAASTSRPSPSWPRATSTSIRPRSATRCGWW